MLLHNYLYFQVLLKIKLTHLLKEEVRVSFFTSVSSYVALPTQWSCASVYHLSSWLLEMYSYFYLDLKLLGEELILEIVAPGVSIFHYICLLL